MVMSQGISPDDLTFPMSGDILMNVRFYSFIHRNIMELKQNHDMYYIPTPLNVQPHFSFVNVFQESIQYCRIYNMPFLSISACTRENPDKPSYSVNLNTGEVNFFHENDIRLLLPGAPRQYFFTTANERLCIQFRLELFPGAGIFPEDGTCHVINSLELRRECESVFAERDLVLRLAACQEFALKVCRRHWPHTYVGSFGSKLFFEPVLRYVRDHVSAKTQIADLAGMLGCSEYVFSRRFHATFGESPKKYLQKELFSRAAMLLADPAVNVKIVAERLSFSTEFYFSKFFKRLSGIAPSEYKKQSDRILFPEK